MGDTPTNASTEQPEAQEPAQETNVTPGQDPAKGEPQSKPELTAEQLQEEIAKVRKEAAKYRTERNQLRATVEEASKTDRSDTDRLTALEKELAEARITAARAQVAAKAEVPPEFITGADEEEMTERAEQLSGWINSQVEKQLQAKLAEHKVMPVVKGENAGGQPLEGDDWLRKMFKQK